MTTFATRELGNHPCKEELNGVVGKSTMKSTSLLWAYGKHLEIMRCNLNPDNSKEESDRFKICYSWKLVNHETRRELSRMRYFKSINLFVGVILGYISPKAFHWECCSLWWLPMIQVLSLSPRWKKISIFFLAINQIFFPWVAGRHLIIWDVFHNTISSLLFFVVGFPTTPF